MGPPLISPALNRGSGVKLFDNAVADLVFGTAIGGALGWTGAQAGKMAVARGASETTGTMLGNLGTFSDSNQANIWSNVGSAVNGQSTPCGCK